MQYTGFLTSLSINQYDLLFLNDQKLSYKLLTLFQMEISNYKDEHEERKNIVFKHKNL